jgi:hypothetical protein
MIVIRYTDTEIVFDSTVVSQFLREGEIIERGGRDLEIKAIITDAAQRLVVFSYVNEHGGIAAATIPYDVEVSVGMVTEHVYERAFRRDADGHLTRTPRH